MHSGIRSHTHMHTQTQTHTHCHLTSPWNVGWGMESNTVTWDQSLRLMTFQVYAVGCRTHKHSMSTLVACPLNTETNRSQFNTTSQTSPLIRMSMCWHLRLSLISFHLWNELIFTSLFSFSESLRISARSHRRTHSTGVGFVVDVSHRMIIWAWDQVLFMWCLHCTLHPRGL